ncbi:ABC transporter ATP-binding protein [Rhizohabitans arisaemae]|uniref:ABC transporter ATP-binding protein n=1 Tax=Rhizohabitans arisaemae TaxID=2720610 RepID=UPI0024B1FD6E|nr:ABC transporter ATP-binding protein [Rhizohabitans arisaemae]
MNGLLVRGLTVRFLLRRAVVHAVADVGLTLTPGRCLAVVGESGCGKSVMAHALLGLLPANARVEGEAWLDGELQLIGAPEPVLARRVRGRRIGLIPQSPATHLTPVRTARSQLQETLKELTGAGGSAARLRTRADSLAARAGLDPADLDRYPHELSGGTAQRVANALALAGDPPIVLADEPTTGLDRPLIEATMAELRRFCDEGRAVLLITHDLRAAELVADDIAVMYAGRIVETAPAGDFFAGPRHPYADGLLRAQPTREFTPIPGFAPELTALPDGCAFGPRCGGADAACRSRPEPRPAGRDRLAACHHPLEGRDA